MGNEQRSITMVNRIKIAEDFSEIPGGRYKDKGAFSGEEFREDYLIEKLNLAIENNEKLIIDLDGGYGYATSFLDEAFGRLKEKYNVELILNTLEFISEEEPNVIKEIINYIEKD